MPESAAEPSKSPHKQQIPYNTHNGPNENQKKILKIKTDHPELSTRQIAAIVKTSNFAVHNALKRYGVDTGAIEAYKDHKADILAGFQHRILTSITDEDIKKAPFGSRVMAAGLLMDKERIERTGSDGTSKPLVVIQVNTVHNSVDSTTCPPQSVIDVV